MAAGPQLTLAYVSDLCEGADVREIKKLDASKRGITRTVDLSVCIELSKLDLSGNALCSTIGIVDCRSLTWLNLSHNNLESLQGIQRLTNLAELKALVLSHNQLSIVPGLHTLTELNSLALSDNQIESIELKTLGKLEKLSLSHNQLREIPDTSGNPELRELRLNDNKLSSLPPTLSQNGKLQLLDVGRNRVRQWEALAPLQNLMRLRSLNIQGNRVCSVEGYTTKVSALVPSVHILDSKRLLHQKLKHSSSSRVASPSPTSPTDAAPPPKKKAKLVSSSASGPDSPVSPLTTKDTASKSHNKIKSLLLTKTKPKKRAGKKHKLQPAASTSTSCASEFDVTAVEQQGGSYSGVTLAPGHHAPLEREHALTMETTAEQSTLQGRLKGIVAPRQKAQKIKPFGGNSGIVKVKEVRRRHQSKHRKKPLSPSEFGPPTFSSWF